MGYRTDHTVETNEDGTDRDDCMGVLSIKPLKEVDYMAVVLFVFQLLDSGMPASQLCTALDTIAEHIPEKHTDILTNSLGRARMAASIVEEFLLKDSFERGKKGT